ncbi:hypothetical protein QYM39_06135 [Pediococcus pentosaceus]|uniref:hypothetical protein n=1 Tax=Pediococcus pentosaceus TaxID=1255 RepID=UPI0026590260|nr:hypothetical protein [Pediococcus pentosaceus]WKF70485.1 hypothetical protein QYM39_06135 [Pediococcus pentosaceus]
MTKIEVAMKLSKLEEYLIPRSVEIGFQNTYRFPNDYGASLIYTPMSYGLELAVLDFNHAPECRITYDTSITDDVLENLSWEETVKVLEKIKELPNKEVEDE